MIIKEKILSAMDIIVDFILDTIFDNKWYATVCMGIVWVALICLAIIAGTVVVEFAMFVWHIIFALWLMFTALE